MLSIDEAKVTYRDMCPMGKTRSLQFGGCLDRWWCRRYTNPVSRGCGGSPMGGVASSYNMWVFKPVRSPEKSAENELP